jgi:hypothetical protein
MLAETERLDFTNAHLRKVLELVASWNTEFRGVERHFRELRTELRVTREAIRVENTPERSAIMQQNLAEYRAKLEALRQALPDFHARLLVEKRRLERARFHTKAASAWVGTNRQTW